MNSAHELLIVDDNPADVSLAREALKSCAYSSSRLARIGACSREAGITSIWPRDFALSCVMNRRNPSRGEAFRGPKSEVCGRSSYVIPTRHSK